MSVAKAMGVARKERRETPASHFFPTLDADAVRAVVRAERARLGTGPIWEPAVGAGDIARVLVEEGYDVVASDLVDRGWPGTVIDNFLNFERRLADVVFSNPPFGAKLPERFVKHAFRLGVRVVVLLLKSNYWNAGVRLPFFERYHLVAVYPLTFRIDFTGEGKPTMDCDWYVWADEPAPFVYQPLARPPACTLQSPVVADLFEANDG